MSIEVLLYRALSISFERLSPEGQPVAARVSMPATYEHGPDQLVIGCNNLRARPDIVRESADFMVQPTGDNLVFTISGFGGVSSGDVKNSQPIFGRRLGLCIAIGACSTRSVITEMFEGFELVADTSAGQSRLFGYSNGELNLIDDDDVAARFAVGCARQLDALGRLPKKSKKRIFLASI